MSRQEGQGNQRQEQRGVQAGFVVYRRVGDKVIPLQARLVKTFQRWEGGRPVGLPRVGIQLGVEIPWPQLYGGHTQWIADQVDRVRQAVKQERARRAARKGQVGAGGATVLGKEVA